MIKISIERIEGLKWVYGLRIPIWQIITSKIEMLSRVLRRYQIPMHMYKLECTCSPNLTYRNATLVIIPRRPINMHPRLKHLNLITNFNI